MQVTIKVCNPCIQWQKAIEAPQRQMSGGLIVVNKQNKNGACTDAVTIDYNPKILLATQYLSWEAC